LELPNATPNRILYRIDDPAVELFPAWGSRPVAPLSSIHTEMFETLERVQKRLFPQAVTLPTMSTGTSDSAQLRAKGVQSYGIGTFGSMGAHGNDERISVQGLGVMVEFIYNAVLEKSRRRDKIQEYVERLSRWSGYSCS
jgi:acetylornithine deacetylase/succinyl-diaminopimelate desuccinylase-like protein